MAIKSTPVRIVLNGTELTAYIDPAWAKEFADRLAADASRRVSATITQHIMEGSLRVVRTRPAAPISACLWRRALDGGNWRKRGHAAHRREV